MKNKALHIFMLLCSIVLILWAIGNTIRILFSPVYIQIIYSFPYIPQDQFGFRINERVEKANQTVRYLMSRDHSEQILKNDLHLNDREVEHMIDVKRVVRGVLDLHLVITVFIIAGLAMVLKIRKLEIFQKISTVSLKLFLTLSVALGVLIAFTWNFFFTTFHQLLFADGTWLFYEHDVLIRLFPEEFWIVSTISLVLLSLLQLTILRLFSSYCICFKERPVSLVI